MSPTLADVFADDPRTAVLRLLKSAGTPLAASEIKQALVSSGVERSEADRKWSAIQRSLRSEPHVAVEGQLYRWVEPRTPEPRTPEPRKPQPRKPQPHKPQPRTHESRMAEPGSAPATDVDAYAALDLLLKGGIDRAAVAELIETVRTALKAGTVDSASGHTDREHAARLRQARLDGLRSLSELAGEIEELVANEVDTAVLVRRVRARLKRSGLEPIDRAGEHTTYDRRLHTAIGGPIRDGAAVTVVRPGYTWTGDGESLLIGKAVVEE